MTRVDIWDKVDPTVLKIPEEKASTRTKKTDASAKADRATKRRRRRRISDVVAAFGWTYLVVKTFVFDIDLWLVRSFAPGLEFVIDYRFFIFLTLTAIAIATLRQSLMFVPYVIFWPVVVIFWKIPRLFYKAKSWTLFIAAINACYSFAKNFRRNLVIRVIEILALLGISVSSSGVVTYPCLAVMGIALLFHYLKAAKVAVQSSTFLKRQQQLIERLFSSDGLRKATSLPENCRSANVDKFDEDQLRNFANNLSLGIAAWRWLDAYTVLISRYRRSTAPHIFGLATFLWLVLQSVVALTFLNYGLFKVRPDEFGGAETASFVKFVYYSVTSLYGNTTPHLVPISDVATLISTFAAIYGPILVLTLATQLLLGVKQSRDDVAFSAVVASTRKNRMELEKRLEFDYEVSVEEAWRRLDELRIGSVTMLTRLAASIPVPDDLNQGTT